MSVLAASDVRLAFGPTEALRGATVTVEAGEIVAFKGPSGSGKSTLLYCLSGVLVPDAGAVVYCGERLDQLPDRERSIRRRGDFGFVFQFGQLVPELTASDNVALPLLLNGGTRHDAYSEAERWLERLEIADVRDHRPGEMSGGQAQRVAIARALVANPRVVFADEPTGALDSLTGERVMAELIDHVRQQAATLVLVTHESRVAAYADRRLTVRDGQVVSPARAEAT